MTDTPIDQLDALQEGFSEQELIAHGVHPRLEHVILYLRNLAVGAAAVLFLASVLHAAHAAELNPDSDGLLPPPGAAPGDVHGLLLRSFVSSARHQLSAALKSTGRFRKKKGVL